MDRRAKEYSFTFTKQRVIQNVIVGGQDLPICMILNYFSNHAIIR